MNVNTFSGIPLGYLLDDGRSFQLAEDFCFCDSRGRIWCAKKGDIANGTSYPKVLWNISGGPWSTKSRWAAIIHDVECSKRTSPWQEVHRMFGEAALAAGVNEPRAEVEVNMLWRFGPRWDKDGNDLETPDWDDDEGDYACTGGDYDSIGT